MNPYHTFLDLPESETQPDYYTLLGLPRFTSDTKLIHDAAIERNTRLRSWDNSRYYREANAVLDEIVHAAAVLEDPPRKKGYDDELRLRLEGRSAPVTTAAAVVFDSLPAAPVADAATQLAAAIGSTSALSVQGLMIGGSAVAGLLIVTTVVVIGMRSNPPAQVSPSTVQDPPSQIDPKTATTEVQEPVTTSRAEPLTFVAFTQDWKRLASTTGSGDNAVIVREAVDNQVLYTLATHAGPVWSVAFSPDGTRLASASSDRFVKVWDVATGQELSSLAGHTLEVRTVAYSADGNLLASGSGDQSVRVWKADGTPVHTLRGHTGAVTAVAFNHDVTRLASTGHDRTIKLWNMETGEEVTSLTGHRGFVTSVAFSSDGKWMATGSYDFTVKLWDAVTGQEKLTLKRHTRPVTSVCFSPDGTRLVSGSMDKTMTVWDVETGSDVLTLTGHADWVTNVSFSPSGKQVASASEDRTVKVWAATIGPLRGHSDDVYGVAFSPDGRSMATASRDQTVKLWNSLNGRELHQLKGHTSTVTSVAFSDDGRTLASGSLDRTVKLWDTTTGADKLTLQGHTGGVDSVAFHPDGVRLASAGEDQIVRIWDTTSGKEIHSLKGHTGRIQGVAISGDGKWLASASHDQTVKIWELGSRLLLRTLNEHSGSVLGVAFNPDGTRVASASADQSIKIWNFWNGKVVHSLRHPGNIYSVAFNPDGTRLVSAASDKTIKVWDTSSGQELNSLKGHSAEVRSVAVSADGKLASVSLDHTIRLWDDWNRPDKSVPAAAVTPQSSEPAVLAPQPPPKSLGPVEVLFTSSDGIVFDLGTSAGTWTQVPEAKKFFPGRPVIVPKPFEAMFDVDQSRIIVRTIGDSVFSVLSPTKGTGGGLDLQRGRYHLRSQRQMPGEESEVAIRIGDDIWRLSFDKKDAQCALEVTPREPVKFEQTLGRDWYLATIHVIEGSVKWIDASSQAQKIDAGHSLKIEPPGAGRPVVEVTTADLDWLDPANHLPGLLRRDAVAFRKRLEGMRLEIVLFELLQDRDPRLQEWAVSAMSATENHRGLLQALADCRHEEARVIAGDALRRWVARKPEHAATLKKDVSTGEIYRLAWGLPPEDATNGIKSMEAVHFLSNSHVEVRELAFQWIFKQTGRKWGYQSLGSESSRQGAMRAMEAHIRRNGALRKPDE